MKSKFLKASLIQQKVITTKQAMEGVSHVSQGLTLSSRNIPFVSIVFSSRNFR